MGCLGVGNTQQDLDVNKDGLITQSRDAYSKMYEKVAKELLQNNKVTIEYMDIELEPQVKEEGPDVYEKLQEISGEIKVLNAKLDGKNIT